MKSFARKRFFLVLLIAIGASILAIACWPKSTDEKPAPVNDAASPDTAASPDEQHRKLVVGRWEDDYQGHRILTVRNDGTATMVVELDGLNALIADKLTFEEKWRIEDGHFIQQAIGGQPATRVKMILKTMGDLSRQEILELTKDRLHLLDADGSTRYDWRRID